jgi:hypothetical protein
VTIEVRQLLIRTQVNARPGSGAPAPALRAEELQQAKAQVLAECKAWLREQLRAQQER